MRHRKKVNHLGRKSEHRKALLSNMATSLILHKRLNTTLAKAKALKVFVEPLITKSKSDDTHSRRVVFSYLGDKFAVSELFREVAQKVANRPGGYTRILKTGFRNGDGAEMCMIELVDYNPAMLKKVDAEQTKKTRRAGRRKKADGTTEVEPTSSATATDSAEMNVEKTSSEEKPQVKAKAKPVAQKAAAASKAKKNPEGKKSKTE
ncbi:MAG TPA: 50S ribosomal protein L17 [Bacteroidales bacterium]|nr:50S ribosomal protein L17 [Bacteroidales bacterium]